MVTDKEHEEIVIQARISIWVMMIASFIIGFNYIFGLMLGEFNFPSFTFILCVYGVMILWIHLIYNPLSKVNKCIKKK